MIRRLAFALVALLLPVLAHAQSFGNIVPNVSSAGAPTSACSLIGQQDLDTNTGNIWTCQNNAGVYSWVQQTHNQSVVEMVSNRMGISNPSDSPITFVNGYSYSTSTFTGTTLTLPTYYATNIQVGDLINSQACIPSGVSVSAVNTSTGVITVTGGTLTCSGTTSVQFYASQASGTIFSNSVLLGYYANMTGMAITGSCLPAGDTIASVSGQRMTLTVAATSQCTPTNTLSAYNNYEFTRVGLYNGTGQTIQNQQACFAGGNAGTAANPANGNLNDVESVGNSQTLVGYFEQVVSGTSYYWATYIPENATVSPLGIVCSKPVSGLNWAPGTVEYFRSIIGIPSPGTSQLIAETYVAQGSVDNSGYAGTAPSYTVVGTRGGSGGMAMPVGIIGTAAAAFPTFVVIGDSENTNPVAGFSVTTNASNSGNLCQLPTANTYGAFVGAYASAVTVSGTTTSISFAADTTSIPFNTQITAINPGVSVTISPCATAALTSGTVVAFGGSEMRFDPYDSYGPYAAGFSPSPTLGIFHGGDAFRLYPGNSELRMKAISVLKPNNVINEMCDNDIAGETSWAAMVALYTAQWNAEAADGAHVWQVTCVPRSNSTLGEDMLAPITIVSGGSGYTPTSTVGFTVPGGTLSTAISGAVATQINCQTNSSGVVTSCATSVVGNYSAAPPISSITPTLNSGSGSGLTVTLQTYLGWRDVASQYAYGSNFYPTVSPTLTAAAAQGATSITVSSTTGISSPMYLANGAGNCVPYGTSVSIGTGSTLNLSNPLTCALTNGSTVRIVDMATEFNDYVCQATPAAGTTGVGTTPSPLSGCLDVRPAVLSSMDSGLWVPRGTSEGLHTQNVASTGVTSTLQAYKAAGTFIP